MDRDTNSQRREKLRPKKPLADPFALTVCARCGGNIVGMLHSILGFTRVIYECHYCGRCSPGKIET